MLAARLGKRGARVGCGRIEGGNPVGENRHQHDGERNRGACRAERVAAEKIGERARTSRDLSTDAITCAVKYRLLVHDGQWLLPAGAHSTPQSSYLMRGSSTA